MTVELNSRYDELFEIWFDAGVLTPKEGGPDVLPIIVENVATIDGWEIREVKFHIPTRHDALRKYCSLGNCGLLLWLILFCGEPMEFITDPGNPGKNRDLPINDMDRIKVKESRNGESRIFSALVLVKYR